ncbi:MAG TPA: hypothetical protein VJ859_02030 [Allosphingosinicella sp.]|nr:hypothetical protein [Allosphingosinicella sp.]
MRLIAGVTVLAFRRAAHAALWGQPGHSRVGVPGMRTVSAAFLQIVIGFVSMGLGPFLPGLLSDLFVPHFGAMSIRYSLLCFSLIWLWAAVHFLLASRTLIRDIGRADIHNAA